MSVIGLDPQLAEHIKLQPKGMRSIKALPPNWSHISEAFPFIRGKPNILYAWGNSIYNPSGVIIEPWIMAHERVHGERQLNYTVGVPGPWSENNAIRTWWRHYILSPQFRLQEEILAHQKEWEIAQKFLSKKKAQRYLVTISQRLASPLYGNLISAPDAQATIMKGYPDDRTKRGNREDAE